MLEKARNIGIEVFVRSCFLQGLFFINAPKGNKILDDSFEKIKVIQDFAMNKKTDVCRVAIDFCLRNKFISYLVLGSETIEQINKNTEIFSLNNRLEFDKTFLDEVKEDNEDIILPYNWEKNV